MEENNANQSSHIGEVDEKDRKIILEFITTSFNARSHKLFESEFDDDCMDLGNTTTSASEGYHQGIKNSVLGPKPDNHMHVTAQKLVKMAESKQSDKSQKASFDANATFAKKKDRHETVKEFSNFANDKIADQYKGCQEKFLQYRISEDKFFVKFDYAKYEDDAKDIRLDVDEYNTFHEEESTVKDEELSNDNTKKLKELREKLHSEGNAPTLEYRRMLHESMKYVIPRLEHTRVVELVPLPHGSQVLVCSCRTLKKRGHACRHMYKLLRRGPTLNDAHVRWQNHYFEDYGCDEELTNAYMDLRSIKLPGILLTDADVARIKSSMPVGSGDRDWDYFERSIGKMCLRGNNTFWTANAERLKHVLGNAVWCPPIQKLGILKTNTVQPSTSHTLPSSTPRTIPPSTTYGPTEMVEWTSSYVVPSQRNRCKSYKSNLVDDNQADKTSTCPELNLLEKFHPRYESLCKFAESADGDDGVKVMEEHFHSCQLRFLNFFHKNNVSNDKLTQPVDNLSKKYAGSNLYHRFKPPYERICKMAEYSGKAGIAVVSEEIAACHVALTALVAGKEKLSNNKKDRRCQKITSPKKRSKR